MTALLCVPPPRNHTPSASFCDSTFTGAGASTLFSDELFAELGEAAGAGSGG